MSISARRLRDACNESLELHLVQPGSRKISSPVPRHSGKSQLVHERLQRFDGGLRQVFNGRAPMEVLAEEPLEF